uniref:Uncharacterized protein n=1 Tax=Siphoviridae sp. ctS0613 TaxID=2825506 RepID=A0A8S5QBV0_9CAUD|nr:MAG TPA: hypothetical protein [Siphoviridae sp. ctS0613]
MKIKVVNQRLYLEPPETAEGTREYLKAEFSFSEEWDGMTKTAFFRGADGNTYSQLLKDDACTVPAEALAASGRVGVSVSGTLGETVITTDIKSFSVPATLSGGTPSDPEPTVWQQILDKVDETRQIAQSVRDDADAGRFAASPEMVEQAVSVYIQAALSPEMHRNIFRGKHLGESITEEQLEVIRDGSFADLYVGDYWEINGVKYRIADINYWKNVGYPESEKVQKPHVLIVPDTILGSGQMDTGNSTSGGYKSSTMKTVRLNQIANSLPDAFKNILISHRIFSDGTWITASIDLMNEVMVHGTYICTDNSNKQTSDTQQLSLFGLVPELKVVGVNYWLRNVAGSQTYTLVSQYGDASTDAATSTYGIRPVFAIG